MNKIICLGIGLIGFLALSPLVQSASIIPSRFLPGDEAVSGAASDQTTPVIAAGGNTMLAVWSDRRSSPASSPFYEFETSHDAPMQILSHTAIGSIGAMMIWRSDTSTTNRIMIQPLDLNGNEKYNDRGVRHNITYRYRVFAESNTGPSGFSNIAVVTTRSFPDH